MATKKKEPATIAEVRTWATEKGIITATRGRLKAEVVEAFRKAHSGREVVSPSK